MNVNVQKVTAGKATGTTKEEKMAEAKHAGTTEQRATWPEIVGASLQVTKEQLVRKAMLEQSAAKDAKAVNPKARAKAPTA